jgi:Cu/Ag efflux protein CusF
MKRHNRHLMATGIVALLAAPLMLAVEPVTAVHGTITKVDSTAKTITLKLADGTEQTLRMIGKTAVHGTEAGAKEAFHGLKEGSEVVAHYSTKGTQKTAVEVDNIGKDGMHAVGGTISEIDRDGKKLVVKAADGTEQTFKMADQAAKVTVYYTEAAGKKIAHFFEK